MYEIETVLRDIAFNEGCGNCCGKAESEFDRIECPTNKEIRKRILCNALKIFSLEEIKEIRRAVAFKKVNTVGNDFIDTIYNKLCELEITLECEV